MSNTEIARRFYDAYNRRDWEEVRSLLSPQAEWFHAARGELVNGVEGVIALLRSSAEAFPDAKVEVRAVHESGDVVVAECAYRVPRVASSEQPTFCEVGTIKDGRFIRGSTYADTLQMLLELECRRAA